MSTARRHPYTTEEIRELKELDQQSAHTRPSDPADSLNRKAGDEFAKKVAEIRDSVKPPYKYIELGPPLGIKAGTLRAKLARRGYEVAYPSQRKYSGKPYKENRRTATHFSCGHPREGNTYWNKRLRLDVCAMCQRKYVTESRRKANNTDTNAETGDTQ